MDGRYKEVVKSHHKQHGRSKIEVDDVSNTRPKILIDKKKIKLSTHSQTSNYKYDSHLTSVMVDSK